jgi:hypothetical protein
VPCGTALCGGGVAPPSRGTAGVTAQAKLSSSGAFCCAVDFVKMVASFQHMSKSKGGDEIHLPKDLKR